MIKINKCAGVFGLLFGHRFKENFIFNKDRKGAAIGLLTFCTRCGCEPGNKIKEEKAP